MCNGHALDCQYDTGLDSAVCVNCTDGTAGSSCDHCLPQFYQNSSVPLSDPNICIGRQNYCEIPALHIHVYVEGGGREGRGEGGRGRGEGV